jgi:CheY-like chemotaxis protein
LQTDQPDTPAGPTYQPPGVLVVDDDPDVRGFVRAALTRAGYQVFDAPDLGGAVRLFEQVGSRVRVALLDVSMPGAGGPEVLRELRRLRPGLPAVFMSGELDPGFTNALAVRLRADAPDGLIAKPMSAADLAETLEAAIDGSESRAAGGRRTHS